MRRTAAVLLFTALVGAGCSSDGKGAQSGKVEGATITAPTTSTEAPTTTTAAPTTTTTAPPPSPEETVRMLTAAEAAGDWDTAWSFVHPDGLKYTTKAQYIKDQEAQLARGYQFVSVDVKQVTLVKWVFPKCVLAAFGPKTYEGAAAVQITYQAAGPSGSGREVPAVTHLVKGPAGRWLFFPTVGCNRRAGL
jgi:hypothetical protein